MMGRTHAASGLVAGAVLLPWVGTGSVAESVAWLVSCAGMALLPDLDQRGTTAARMWGPVSQLAAMVVGWVARGHRNGTHDALLAPVVLGGLAWCATQNETAGMVLAAKYSATAQPEELAHAGYTPGGALAGLAIILAGAGLMVARRRLVRG